MCRLLNTPIITSVISNHRLRDSHRNSVISLPETPAAEAPKSNVVTPESTHLPAVQQDPKAKVGGLKLERQIHDRDGNAYFENKDPNGNITQRFEKVK